MLHIHPGIKESIYQSHKKKLSEAHKGKSHPWLEGRKLTQEHKAIISKANTGRKRTDEERQRNSKSLTAFFRARTSERRSNSLKKYWTTHPPANKGVPHTDVTKRKISKAMKEYWSNRKHKKEFTFVEW